MAKVQYARLAANNPVFRVFAQNSSLTTGVGLTGLAYNTAGLYLSVIRELDATVTQYKVDTDGNLETISTLGTYAAPTAGKARFKEVDATKMPGVYEIHLAQAMLGTGDASRFITGYLMGATNLAPCLFEVQLDAVNPQDSVRMGMTALPNAAADAAGGLPISDAGGLDMDAILGDTNDIQSRIPAALTASGNIKSNVLEWNTAAVTTLIDLVAHSGTAQAGAASTITLQNTASATNNLYVGALIVLTGGTGAGQTRRITGYDGGTFIATVSRAWTTNPNATTTYAVFADDPASTVAAGGLADDAITAAVIATGAIDADAIATDALGALELSTGAVTEIIAGLLNTVNTGATYNVNNSVGKQIRQAAGTATISILTGTCQAGSTTNTIKLSSAASTITDAYVGALVWITGGTGLGQSRRIIAYNGTTKVATVDRNWVTIPTGTSTFEIDAASSSPISHEGTAQAGGDTSITLSTGASAVDDIYNGSFVSIMSGTGSGQTRVIADYNGTTKAATVDSAWSVNPDNTSAYVVLPAGAMDSTPTTFPTAGEIAYAVAALLSIEGGLTDEQWNALKYLVSVN